MPRPTFDQLRTTLAALVHCHHALVSEANRPWPLELSAAYDLLSACD